MKSTKGHNSSKDMDWTPNSALTSAGMIGSNPMVYKQTELEAKHGYVVSNMCFNLQVFVLTYASYVEGQFFYKRSTKLQSTYQYVKTFLPQHRKIIKL